MKFGKLDESLTELEKRLRLPMEKWVKRSKILDGYRRQTRITRFLMEP